MSPSGDVEAELSVALEAAEVAGDLLLDYTARGVRQRKKSGKELVSEADLAAQSLIVDRIRAAFPADTVIAEESGGGSGPHDASRRWFVDPLDGTTNFLKSQPRWGTSIAFYDGRNAAAGVVTCPPRHDTYHAATNHGAFLNGEPIRCSGLEEPGDAVISSGFPYDFTGKTNLEEWMAITPRVLSVRSLGAAAIDLCDVASGRSDAFWEQRLGLWDTAAGIIIAAEAGALVTDMDGNLLREPSHNVVAANPVLHAKVLSILRSACSKNE